MCCLGETEMFTRMQFINLLFVSAISYSFSLPHSLAAQADELHRIRAAPYDRNGDLGYWAAVDQGFFRDEGIDVVSEALESRVLARDAVTSGSVELSHVSINTSLPAFEAGEPIKVVASIFPRWPIVTILQPEILDRNKLTREQFRQLDAKDRIALLKDSRIAIGAAGSLSDQTIRSQIRAAGIADPDAFASIQYVQSVAALEANFLQGRLDAIVSDAAGGIWFERQGEGVQLLNGDEQDRYLPETVIPAGAWVVNTDWLAKGDNRNVLRAFLAAWVKGNQWVAGLPDDKFREWLLAGYPEVKDPVAQDKLILIARTNLAETAIDGRLKPELLQRVVDFALQQKTIKKPIAVDALYSWEYLP